jgi:hypothetical protein
VTLVYLIIGALFAWAITELVFEAIPYWREQSARIDADLEFLQAIPQGVEEKPGELWANELERRQRQVPTDREWS